MTTYVDLVCDFCGNSFKRSLSDNTSHSNRRSKKTCCSSKCRQSFQKTSQTVTCKQCEKPFLKRVSQIKKYFNHFCSRSCSVTYNNLHKKHGTRRSKLEQWLEEQLPSRYLDLEFHFNSKDAIGSELDIYIPSLKLAFELNGIYHYEPIHGETKLASIQSNDANKFVACQEAGISLCIIDVSSQKYFKEKSSKKFLDIITKIIDDAPKMSE